MRDKRPAYHALPDPETKPDVPSYAEKMNILAHVRHQFHPMFLNAIGGPDANGPREYIGIDLRCPLCWFIQPLGPPGVEGECRNCSMRYKYTAAKGNTFLWIWKQQKPIEIDSDPAPKILLLDNLKKTHLNEDDSNG